MWTHVSLRFCAGVEFKTNTLVTGADVKAHTLTTESGDTITYEKLIVATGSGVRGWPVAATARSRTFTGCTAAAGPYIRHLLACKQAWERRPITIVTSHVLKLLDSCRSLLEELAHRLLLVHGAKHRVGTSCH